MSSRLLKFVLVVAALLLFTACKKVTPTPIPTPIATEPPAAEVITCPPDYLAAPVLTGPAPEALVDSLTPSLTWSFPDVPYPDAGSSTLCIPEQYKVDVLRGPFFRDNLGSTLTGKVTSFTTPALLPGQQYLWGVTGISGGTLGPPPAFRLFYTGETCDPAAFLAPELMSPANHATVSTLEPLLYWENPGDCVPANYFLDFSADPTFVTGNLGGTLPSSDPSSMPNETLSDCTRYYWRMAARSADGSVIGPVSDTFTFRTNTGGCEPEPEHLINGISGRVWEDLCSVPEIGPLPSPLPAGCVSVAGRAVADGIREPGEPGIANVMVRLGEGACPSTGLGVTFTDEYGFYGFEVLPDTTYCVSVDATENISALLPGGWTSPASDSSKASIEMTFPNLEAYFYGMDFGWSYQFGPTVPYTTFEGLVFDDHCAHTLSTDPAMVTEGCLMGSDGIITANGTREGSEEAIANVWITLFHGTCGSPSRIWAGTDKTDDYGRFQFFLPLTEPATNYCISITADTRVNSRVLMPGIWSRPRTVKPLAELDVVAVDATPLTDLFGWDRTISPVGILDRPTYEFSADDYCYFGPGMEYRALRRLSMGDFYTILAVDPSQKWVQIEPDKPLSPYLSCIADPDPPYIQIDDEVTWGMSGNSTGGLSAIFKIDDEVTWGRIGVIDPDPPTLEHILRIDPVGLIGIINPDPPTVQGCGLIDPDPPTDQHALRCWVPILRGNVMGDLLELPRITGPAVIIPPTPTFTPTTPPQQQPPSCSDFTDQTTCNNHANDMQCYWNTYLKPPQCVKQ